jgi:chromosome segregation ATPase
MENILLTNIKGTFVPESEYIKLYNENTDLKMKINKLYSDGEMLRDTIKTNELTINELRKENEMLKEKLANLENHIEKQNTKIVNLENHIEKQNTEIVNLKNHIEKQNTKIDNLENRIEKIENREKLNKYIIAIQDINRIEKLENIMTTTDKNNLIKLRKSRITECHYLDDMDSQSLIDDKRTVLLEKMNMMEPEIKKIFDKKYPNLIENIMVYIAPTKTNVSQIILDEINEWWIE